MKKRVIKLSVDIDFLLIGISTRLSAHKLSWLLNTQLDTRFKQIDDLVVKGVEKAHDVNYAVYEYETKSDISYKLIENKNTSGTLIKKLNNIDYLLKIEGSFSEKNRGQFVKKIRETEHIIACLSIDTEGLKSKELELIS